MTSPSSCEVSVLIGRIYDCALDPTQWGQTLAALKDFLQCGTIGPSLRLDGDGSAEACGAHGLELVRLLVPHLRRAAAITSALYGKAFEAACLSEALNALKTGVVLTNEKARVVYANRAAKAMMRRDGPLSDVEGDMRAVRPLAMAKLRAALEAAARRDLGAKGLAVRLSDDDEKPVVAYVLPLAASGSPAILDAQPVAAVLINVPSDEAECARTLASTFKLTEAETGMLNRLLAGKTIMEAAADASVAMTTARTHLKRIFAKTGVSRQSDLIRLAAAAAPVIPNRDHAPPTKTRAGGVEKRVAGGSVGQSPIQDLIR